MPYGTSVLIGGQWLPMFGPPVSDLPPPPPPPPPSGAFVLDWNGSATFDNYQYLADQLAAMKLLAQQQGFMTPTKRLTIGIKPGSFRCDGPLNLRQWDYTDFVFAGARLYHVLSGIDAGWKRTISDGSIYSTRISVNMTFLRHCTLDGLIVQGPYTTTGPYAATAREVADPRFGRYNVGRTPELGFAAQTGCLDLEVSNIESYEIGSDHVYVGGTGLKTVDRPMNIRFRGLLARFGGRQACAVTNASDVLFEDFNIEWNGRSGLDIEPINANDQYVHRFKGKGLHIGSRYYPFTVAGIRGIAGFDADKKIDIFGNPITHRRQDLELEGCEGVIASSAHPAVTATRDGKGLTIRDHVDHRQGSETCLLVSSWEGVDVDHSIVATSRNTPVSTGVRLKSCLPPITIRNHNVFNGEGSQAEGADTLYILEQNEFTGNNGNVVASTDVVHVVKTPGSGARKGIMTKYPLSDGVTPFGNGTEVIVTEVVGTTGVVVGGHYFLRDKTGTYESPAGTGETFKLATAPGGAAINLGGPEQPAEDAIAYDSSVPPKPIRSTNRIVFSYLDVHTEDADVDSDGTNEWNMGGTFG